MPWSRPVPAIDGRGEGRVSWFSATMGQMETQLEGGGFRGSAERKLYPPRPARCATWDGQRMATLRVGEGEPTRSFHVYFRGMRLESLSPGSSAAAELPVAGVVNAQPLLWDLGVGPPSITGEEASHVLCHWLELQLQGRCR